MIPEEWFLHNERYIAVKINDDKMAPKYNENDIVIFKLTNDFENNKDCLVSIKDFHTTFRRIILNDKGIEWILPKLYRK